MPAERTLLLDIGESPFETPKNPVPTWASIQGDLAQPVRRHTRAGDICFEPFSGSGSQIIVGERLGRRVFPMDLEPVFVDVAIRRWQEATEKAAVLDRVVSSFEEIATGRRAK